MFAISPLLALLAALFAAFICRVADGAPQTPENAPWNVNHQSAHSPKDYYGKAPSDNYQYFASPKDWRQESIYQVITDRFADGNPENNEGQQYRFGGYNLRRIDMRHGGDFAGLKSRLPYLKSLGYTAVWVSPIFQNMENSYHGYAQIDFTLLDDRFGTLQDFRDMVKAAHAIGLRVIVDIVVNHMADLFHFEGHRGSWNVPFRMHLNEYQYFPHNPGRQYTDFVVNNTFFPTGRYGPVYDDRGHKVVDASPYEGSFWSSDFHHAGDLRDEGYGNPWTNHLGKIYGLMDDLRTTHPRVVEKIIAMTKALITSTDIDGIRMDTPMQVPLSFFQDWVPAVRKHAESLGKHNFGFWAEFYCTRERASTMTGRGMTKEFDRSGNVVAQSFIGTEETRTFDGGIHYPVYYWFRNSVRDQGHDVAGLMHLLASDFADYDFSTGTKDHPFQYRHLHFYNNHDQVRMAGATPDGLNKTAMSSAIIAFWPGIPLFYYGDEQGFNTTGSAYDGFGREDFMTSFAWQQPDVCGRADDNPASRNNFDQTHPMFLYTQKVMNVRRQYWNLQKCDSVYERWHQQGFTNGIYAYTRGCGETISDHVLVAFNTWRQPEEIPAGHMYSGWPGRHKIANVMGPTVADGTPVEYLTTDDRGVVEQTITLNPYEVKVFVLVEGLRTLDPVVESISPKHDVLLNLNGKKSAIITIRFSQSMDRQSVMQALTLNGQPVAATLGGSLKWCFTNCFGRQPSMHMRVSNDDQVFVVAIPSSMLVDGIHHVGIDDSAKSQSGRPMHGAFASRFRIGSVENNVIVNPCLNFGHHLNVELMSDRAVDWECKRLYVGWGFETRPYLVSSDIRFKLSHFAKGAQRFRVKLGDLEHHVDVPSLASLHNISADGTDQIVMTQPAIALNGPWSEWMDYHDETVVDLIAYSACAFGGHAVESGELTVQYWVDGSAAYYVTAKF